MLSFLQKLFSKQEENICLNELEEIIEIKRNEEESKVLSRAEHAINKIKRLIKELKDNNDELTKAEIPDEEHVDQKIKTIVKSQLFFYIKQINLFVDKVVSPKEITLENAKEFLNNINQELNMFTQKTQKSFAIGYHLFHAQLDSIKNLLKQISEDINNLRNIIESLETPTYQLSLLINTIKQNQRLANELESKKNILCEQDKQLKTKIENLKKELDNLTEDNDIKTVKNQLNVTIEKEKAVQEKINCFFVKTRRLWLKLAKKNPELERTINTILSDPLITHPSYHVAYSKLVSAIEKKQLGNEEYGKTAKALNDFKPETYFALIEELKKIKMQKERYYKIINPHEQKIEDTYKNAKSLESECEKLSTDLTKIEEDIEKPKKVDFAKISEMSSLVLEKKVRVNA